MPDKGPSRAWQRMLSGRRLDLLEPSPLDIEIEETVVLGPADRVVKSTRPAPSANLFGEQAVFLLKRRS